MIEKKLTGILRKFFPKAGYTEQNISKKIDTKELIIDPSSLTNYLASALLDETLLEVELGSIKQVFFSRLLDIPLDREPFDNADNNIPHENDTVHEQVEEGNEHQKGGYLDKRERVVITPLEPAKGNYLINTDPKILLRAHTPQLAIEFCCYYESKIKIDTMPALQVSFPLVARQVKGAREYRVKVPEDMDLKVNVKIKGSKSRFTTKPMDMSRSGMSLYDPKGKNSALQTNDKLSVDIISGDMVLVSLNAEIRHVTRLRSSSGLQYIFGISIEDESQSIQSQVEKIVASVQRARLRKLAEIEDQYGINLSGW